ncbi:MAG TPA: radical SAM protein [Candidatus Dormibacteraeota bacterium]|jgi:pyruvate-formate lyase-activating enzyme|nr:radical SAM protein [Candidatus Dormibacteraeota bacterium]
MATARTGRRLVPLRDSDLIPLPAEATIAHLPGRRALTLDDSGAEQEIDSALPVAAVLPVGYLRTLLPASDPSPGAPRLPLYGYTAIAEHRGELSVAALRTDTLGWWSPSRFQRPSLGDAVAAARRALPGNRVVEQLAVCALEHNCYTAQNTFHQRYEGALPASPACNADCLGCISLQPDPVPTPQPRIRHAPTPDELAGLAAYHLRGAQARIVSFGQGCEGEPLTRPDALEEATARIRREFPDATIHVNTNGSSPGALERLVRAGCNSVRVSAISFTDSVFRAYYRPAGYTLDDVVACGRVMADAGGQVCLNLLTFPGITDVADELERTVDACRRMGVHQVQWRSLNVDHDWLTKALGEMPAGIGMAAALKHVRVALPGVHHGNFTRPAAPLKSPVA